VNLGTRPHWALSGHLVVLAEVAAYSCREFLAGHAQDVHVRYSDVPDIRIPSKNLPATARCLNNAECFQRKRLDCTLLAAEFTSGPMGHRQPTSVASPIRDLASPIGSGSGGKMFFQRPRMSGTSEERTGSLGASAGKTFSRRSRGGLQQTPKAKRTIGAKMNEEIKWNLKC